MPGELAESHAMRWVGIVKTWVPGCGRDTNAIPSVLIDRFMNGEDTGERAKAIKSRFISLAQSLPEKMSQEYADVVLLCLQYLDSPPSVVKGLANEENVKRGEFDDEDGIALGVSYMENILLRVHDLKIVD